MQYQIVKLTDKVNGEYEKFLKFSESSLFYVSIKYKKFLENLLGCKSVYFLALNVEQQIVGSFPLMIKENRQYGNVANSLPYYGSNGCTHVLEKLTVPEKNNVKKLLLKTVQDYTQQQNCVSSTIITNPFENEIAWYDDNCDFDFSDKRIGQITHLPPDSSSVEDQLIKSFQNPRPRNIRKAIKSDIKCPYEN
jgi:hypothetical protein